jgi:hypothetical protein
MASLTKVTCLNTVNFKLKRLEVVGISMLKNEFCVGYKIDNNSHFFHCTIEFNIFIVWLKDFLNILRSCEV